MTRLFTSPTGNIYVGDVAKCEQPKFPIKQFLQKVDLSRFCSHWFNYILNYQDHLSKYCYLRPLKTKSAAKIADHLDAIFTDISCPKILHADNGKEFVNKAVDDVLALWQESKVI